MYDINTDLRDVLLVAAYSKNDFHLDSFKSELEAGINFIEWIQSLKESDPEEFKRLQDAYLSRWSL